MSPGFPVWRGRAPLSFLASVLDAEIGGLAIGAWENTPKKTERLKFVVPSE
jgi:hypothetical protein